MLIHGHQAKKRGPKDPPGDQQELSRRRKFRSESRTDFFHSGLGLGQDVALQGDKAQGRSHVLSLAAQHVVEGVLDHVGLAAVACFVGQHPGEGGNG